MSDFQVGGAGRAQSQFSNPRSSATPAAPAGGSTKPAGDSVRLSSAKDQNQPSMADALSHFGDGSAEQYVPGFDGWW